MNKPIKSDSFQENGIVVYSADFLKKIEEFEKILSKKHIKISNTSTPKSKIKKLGKFDYVNEGYMRDQLNKDFPMWSWLAIPGHPPILMGGWIVTDGELEIVDNGYKRRFYSPGAARVQFKSGGPKTAENVIDLDNNLAAANTNAFKRGVNRLCNIADDVYRKVFDEPASTKSLKEIDRLMPMMPDEKQISIKKHIKERGDELSEAEAQTIIDRMKELC